MSELVKVTRTITVEYTIDIEDYGDMTKNEIVAFENDPETEFYPEDITGNSAKVEFIDA